MREYKFDVELEALHDRIAAEYNITKGNFVPVNHETIRPLVILMDKLLAPRIRDYKARRQTRLDILSLWLERKVNSTNDLTVYQCSTILSFLEYDYNLQGISERAKRFLTDSQKTVEGSGVHGEELTSPDLLSELPPIF
jgi:hypothetical protein